MYILIFKIVYYHYEYNFRKMQSLFKCFKSRASPNESEKKKKKKNYD